MGTELKVGVIGYGNMASAIIGGALKKGLFSSGQLTVCDKSEAARDRAAALGASVTESPDQVFAASDLTLLAVKPQQIDDVLAEVNAPLDGRCVLSIVTGITSAYLAERLCGALIIRAMPNTPVLLGYGAAVLSLPAGLPDEFRKLALALFSDPGVAEVIPEEKMNAMIAINGSSPAYFFKLAELTCSYAETHGISAEMALRFFAATMEGAAHMLTDSGFPPEELRRQVCSPGGTTLAALAAMEDGGLPDAYLAGLEACLKRADELAK